jgi:PDZ domain
MLRNAILCFFLLFLLVRSEGLEAQNGFYLTGNKKQVDIPFEYTNDFIILTVEVNQSLPLKFIFDSGAEHSILCKRDLADLLHLDFEREFRVMGSDLKTELVAYLARRVHFEINEKAVSVKEDILVLEEDYFRFEEFAGVNVHGILAANIFSKFIFKINYQTKILTLYEREHFKGVDDSFSALPLEVFRNKLYLNTKLQVLRDSVVDVKLLIDTGAGLPLLIFTNTHPQLHPPENALAGHIGMGLGGFLEGFNGRIHKLKIGDFEQKQIVAQFQLLDSMINVEHINQRNGLIGNALLNRFVVYFDYEKEKIWLKPNKYYKKEYDFDRSGLTLIVAGKTLATFLVQFVLPNSPAAALGIQKGDTIVSVGHLPSHLMSLEDVLRKLKRKPGKKIRVVIKRDGKRMVKNIILRDLL